MYRISRAHARAAKLLTIPSRRQRDRRRFEIWAPWIDVGTLSIEPGLPRVSVDPERLSQITNNLLGNAIKLTPPGGRIGVRVDPVDSHVRLTVADSGEAISPELLPLVFERFRQADSSRPRPHGGLGIGLAIVKHLVELHGGTGRDSPLSLTRARNP